jgi:lipopolysaccharide export system protein LptC
VMMARYRQLLMLSLIWGGAPLLAGFYLHHLLGLEQTGHSAHRSVEELPMYHGVKAMIYSSTGRLDYHLRADRLIMQSDAGSVVHQPVVNLVSGNLGAADLGMGPNMKKQQNVQIQSGQARISAEDVSFSKDVTVVLNHADHAHDDQRMIRADHLRYKVNNQFFVAQGGVRYCHGVEEVLANKLSGFINKDDFVFEDGRIVFKKRPGC